MYLKRIEMQGFKSFADKYNVVDFSPFGRDVVGELAESCYKYGLKFGLYYSQDLDWHEEHGGGVNYFDPWLKCDWANNWDFPDKEKKDLNIFLEKKAKPQIKELLTKYGDLLCIWCDDPCDINKEHGYIQLNQINSTRLFSSFKGR